MLAFEESLINVATMRDARYGDDFRVVVDDIHDTLVTDADTP